MVRKEGEERSLRSVCPSLECRSGHGNDSESSEENREKTPLGSYCPYLGESERQGFRRGGRNEKQERLADGIAAAGATEIDGLADKYEEKLSRKREARDTEVLPSAQRSRFHQSATPF